MLACTGKPYDTLEEIIGIRGEKGNGSLIDFGVKYEQVDLVDEMYPDYDEIAKKAVGAKIAYIQRSRGFSQTVTDSGDNRKDSRNSKES